MKRRANPPKRRRNQKAFDTSPKGRLPVVLTAVNPRLQCSVFTEEHGTFCITGTAEMKPDIRTLSTMQPKCGEWNEVPVFGGKPQAKLGLQEHLLRLVDHKAASSIPNFLQQSERIFHELLALTKECNATAKKTEASTSWTLEYADELTKHLEELERVHGNYAVQELSDDLLKMALQYKDTGGRLHLISLKLSPDTFPHSCPECASDLPIKWQPPWKPAPSEGDKPRQAKRIKVDPNSQERDASSEDNDSGYGLVRLYASFKREVDKHQDLWNELDDLDASAWILEPSTKRPCRSTLHRRIAVTEESSIVIGLDRNCPRGPPTKTRWIGPNTSAYCSKLDQYIASMGADIGWSLNLSVKENLERGLGLHLPLPPSETTEASLECSICYSHDLPSEDGSSEFPDAVCDNPPCKRFYHETCLLGWLQSLSSSRKSFDRIIGTCPYCNEPISATIRQTL